MGNTHVAAAESYLSYKAGKLGGEQLGFTKFPVFGTATSHSASHQVTCSSASGTAIACGEKANNGTVGINKDSVKIQSVAYALKEAGYKIGIMSSVPVNHATPASFYAHNHYRGNYYEISSEIPQTGFDFFGGSGFLQYTGPNGDLEPTDAYLEKNGYVVSYGIKEFKEESVGQDKMVFCQESSRQESAANYVSGNEAEDDASLAEVVDLAINFLGDEKPFFIMCEGGAIDWEGHANKTMTMINEVLEFDKAIQVAYEFYLKHKDETLIVVTADHETGGITLGSAGYINWEKFENQWLESGKQNNLEKDENRKLNKECGIIWTTGGHTGGAVPVYAIGKGAVKFAGRIDNTDIKGKILCE